jgi:hypothetical protein
MVCSVVPLSGLAFAFADVRRLDNWGAGPVTDDEGKRAPSFQRSVTTLHPVFSRPCVAFEYCF